MVSVTHDDITVETNTGDDAAVRLAMGVPEAPADDTAPAAETADAGADVPPVVGEDATADHVDASATSAADPDKPAKKAKPRDNPQARIAQEIDRRKAAEARAAHIEAELQQLRSRPAPAPVEPPAPARAKPREEEVGTKYPSYADFIEDLADWKAEQRLTALRPAAPIDQIVAAEIEKREQVRQRVEAQRAFEAREEQARATYPDYQDQVDRLISTVRDAGTPFPPVALEAIFQSEQAGHLLYWLATHPTEALQLARDVSHYDVVAAPLVRQVLEARLGSVAVPGSGPAARESRAQPPIKPVGASPVSAPSDEPSDDESFEQYFARENARARKAGRR